MRRRVAGPPRASRPAPSHSFVLPPDTGSVEAVAHAVMRRLQVMRRGPQHQQPALYLPSGARLSSVAEVLAAPCVLVFEGGLWMWPAVEVGHRIELEVERRKAELARVSTILASRERELVKMKGLASPEDEVF